MTNLTELTCQSIFKGKEDEFKTYIIDEEGIIKGFRNPEDEKEIILENPITKARIVGYVPRGRDERLNEVDISQFTTQITLGHSPVILFGPSGLASTEKYNVKAVRAYNPRK